jgi:hypothetical protein
MIGVKNIMVVLDVWDRSRRGTEAERKRTSSVMGPWGETSEELGEPARMNVLQQNCASRSNY